MAANREARRHMDRERRKVKVGGKYEPFADRTAEARASVGSATRPPSGMERYLDNGFFVVMDCARDDTPIRLLIVQRRTGEDGISWDDLQWIKAQLGYGDREAVEMYPREGGVVNVANARHLWVLPADVEMPCGYKRAPEKATLDLRPLDKLDVELVVDMADRLDRDVASQLEGDPPRAPAGWTIVVYGAAFVDLCTVGGVLRDLVQRAPKLDGPRKVELFEKIKNAERLARIDAEAESVRDGLELVRRFRRLMDPDIGVATPEEVSALSEYLSRVDALVNAVGETQS